jgi:hypothetical protein
MEMAQRGCYLMRKASLDPVPGEERAHEIRFTITPGLFLQGVGFEAIIDPAHVPKSHRRVRGTRTKGRFLNGSQARSPVLQRREKLKMP